MQSDRQGQAYGKGYQNIIDQIHKNLIEHCSSQDNYLSTFLEDKEKRDLGPDMDDV